MSHIEFSAKHNKGFVSGEMTHIYFEALWLQVEAVRTKLKSSQEAFQLDLSKVTQVDSTAIAFLLALKRVLAEIGRVLVVKSEPSTLAQLAKLYNL